MKDDILFQSLDICNLLVVSSCLKAANFISIKFKNKIKNIITQKFGTQKKLDCHKAY